MFCRLWLPLYRIRNKHWFSETIIMQYVKMQQDIFIILYKFWTGCRSTGAAEPEHGVCGLQSDLRTNCLRCRVPQANKTSFFVTNKDNIEDRTVRKMDLILRPIERRPQMQFSMGRRFKLQLLRRYSVKFSKMRNITLGTPWLGKLKNTGRRRTSILRICSLWLYHCATVTCDICAVF